MSRIHTDAGETKCYDCRTVIVRSKDLDTLLAAIGPCPKCGSERVGYMRSVDYLRCDCGAHVPLTGFTNSCDCGADYNRSGQKLAPREQWGEETGESLADILNIP